MLNLCNGNKYDVYIGRKCHGHWDEDDTFGNPCKDGTKEEMIEGFKVYFHNRLKTDAEFKRRVLGLKGKRLGCFCKPEPCHGDIIADYLNNLTYDDYLIDGVPIWEREKRGMTEEEVKEYKEEVARLRKGGI